MKGCTGRVENRHLRNTKAPAIPEAFNGSERTVSFHQLVWPIWPDAAPGEDEAGGIWAERREKASASRHLSTQPKREVHRSCADESQAAPSEPDRSRAMVPGA